MYNKWCSSFLFMGGIIRQQQLHLFMSQLANSLSVTSTSKPNKACCWNHRVLEPDLNLSAPGFKWIAEVLKVVPSCEIKFSCLWCKRFAMFLDPNWCLFNSWQHQRRLSAAAWRWTDEILNRESLSGRVEAAATATTSTNPRFILPHLTPAALTTPELRPPGEYLVDAHRPPSVLVSLFKQVPVSLPTFQNFQELLYRKLTVKVWFPVSLWSPTCL